MARIAESELERLKAEVSVARLIEASGIKLEKRGRDLIGACPFHQDDTPSLTVTPEKNLFHCFGPAKRASVTHGCLPSVRAAWAASRIGDTSGTAEQIRRKQAETGGNNRSYSALTGHS